MRAVAVAALLAFCGDALAAPELSVRRYTHPGPGSVNSYVVDTGEHLVIVDAQRSLSEGGKLADLAETQGKPVAGILLTHPHPDHVGGLPAVARRFDAPLFASRATAQELRADTMRLLALTRRVAPNDSAAELPAPTGLVSHGEVVTMGGRRFEITEYGPGESLTMTTYYEPVTRSLFAGDLFGPGMTPFLLERRARAWLDQLNSLEERYPAETTVFPGHGEPGPLRDQVAAQRRYLTDFLARVEASLSGDGQVTSEEKAGIVGATEAAYPNHPPVAEIPDLLARNVDAVAAELRGEPPAPPVSTLPAE